MSNFVRGMQTGLYVSEPAPYRQAAAKPEPLELILQAYRAAGTLGLDVRSAPGTPTLVVPEGAILRFATMSVRVSEANEVRSHGTRILAVTNVDTGEPGTPISLSAGAKLRWDRMLRVTGTSDSELSINEATADMTSVVYESALTGPTWSETMITSKSWTLPRRGRFRPRDPAYLAVRDANMQAREVFIERVLADENGDPTEVTAGRAHVTGFNTPAPADGLVDANWTFTGQGKLSIGPVPAPEVPAGVMLDFSKAGNAINFGFA